MSSITTILKSGATSTAVVSYVVSYIILCILYPVATCTLSYDVLPLSSEFRAKATPAGGLHGLPIFGSELERSSGQKRGGLNNISLNPFTSILQALYEDGLPSYAY